MVKMIHQSQVVSKKSAKNMTFSQWNNYNIIITISRSQDKDSSKKKEGIQTEVFEWNFDV